MSIPTAPPSTAAPSSSPADPRLADSTRAGILYPRSTADLAAAVQYAVTTRQRVALQATGHGPATHEALDDTVLVRTDRMQGVDVDATTRRARVGAGVLAQDLQSAAGAHALAFLAGRSLDVGVVGYTIFGGVGWLGRRFGLACNTVVGAEVVTADGAVRRVDPEHEPELFWALRGGGGPFAAVASLELDLVPVARVLAGRLLWPIEQAAEVLHCWRVWTSEVPDTITSIARMLRHPSTPAVDAHQRGGHYVGVETVITETEENADIWLRPLRTLKPALDTIAPRPCHELGRPHDDGMPSTPPFPGHQLLHVLSEARVDALLEGPGPGTTPTPAVEIHHLGGAIGRSGHEHGALDSVDASYALHGVTDRPTDPASLFDVEAMGRLRAVKATYDPENRFVPSSPFPLP